MVNPTTPQVKTIKKRSINYNSDNSMYATNKFDKPQQSVLR